MTVRWIVVSVIAVVALFAADVIGKLFYDRGLLAALQRPFYSHSERAETPLFTSLVRQQFELRVLERRLYTIELANIRINLLNRVSLDDQDKKFGKTASSTGLELRFNVQISTAAGKEIINKDVTSNRLSRQFGFSVGRMLLRVPLDRGLYVVSVNPIDPTSDLTGLQMSYTAYPSSGFF